MEQQFKNERGISMRDAGKACRTLANKPGQTTRAARTQNFLIRIYSRPSNKSYLTNNTVIQGIAEILKPPFTRSILTPRNSRNFKTTVHKEHLNAKA